MRDCHILRFLSARVLVAEVMAGLLISVDGGTELSAKRQVLIPPGICYIADIADVSVRRDLVLQLDVVCQDDAMLLTLSGLSGEEVIRLKSFECEPI